MRHLFRAAFVMVWMGFLSGTAWPGTFYVSTTGSDSNPGSQALPWKTLQKAAATLVAGDTAIVLDGTYTEAEVQFNRSGSAGNPITLKAQNKWLAILSSISQCNPAISLYGSYLIIENIRISVSPSNPACSRSPSSANAMIRAWSGGTNPTIRGVLIDPGRDVGIKTDQDNALVENSTIQNGLESIASNNIIYRNNIISGTDAWGSMVTTKAGTRNILVYNNTIHVPGTMQDVAALILGGSSSCCMAVSTNFECYNCVAFNNVIINESGDRNRPMLGMRSCSNCTFMNNVVIGGPWIMSTGGPASSGLSSNPFWYNNIAVCNGGPALASTWNTNGTLTLDYNNFFNCTGAPAQAHAISGDPKLVNQTTDFHLQVGSPAIGTGLMLATRPAYGGGTLDTSHDMSGVLRATPWSLGIYSGSTGTDTTPPAVPTHLRVQ
jgi:hypothetical protein